LLIGSGLRGHGTEFAAKRHWEPGSVTVAPSFFTFAIL
jgi:hypothetical protein